MLTTSANSTMTDPLPNPAPSEALTPAPSDSTPADASPKQPLRTIPSTELLQGQREVVIVHQGEHYRLRLTRNDRLVLYK